MPLTYCAYLTYVAAMEKEKDPRIITPIPRELLQAIDDYRFEQRLASRAEAIRKLIQIGLDSLKLGDAAEGDEKADAPKEKPRKRPAK